MNINDEFDTISAISTPLGTGGLGVIRISGDNSFNITRKIFNDEVEAGKICHGWIIDDGVRLDEVVVLPFKAPKSYTGEDVVEIQCHGGINVVRNILDAVLKNGARMAERGEFTKRAFLNKKLDLSQAEAVADLIHSKTKRFAKQSAKNLSGMLTQRLAEIKRDIFKTLSKIIACIDFPEDVSEPAYDSLINDFEVQIEMIDGILSDASSSNIMRQGIKIAICGKPNVGKSSLFNALLNLDRAIVTDVAGTTRDILTETLDLGIPVTLVDTAGIRNDENVDKVEEIGIQYSKQAAQDADLVLFVFDINQGFQNADLEILNFIKNKKYIAIANKCDLKNGKLQNAICISTKNNVGIDELKQKIKDIIFEISPEDTEFITNERQQECLKKARECLIRSNEAAMRHELQDLISIDVKQALLCLDEITGEVITDEILNNIFDNFCIGK